ncbi:hypothetical protein AXK56_16665 [Tsukamurella pulmonis]|uniref:Uncharacterized protein n=1 Tax=Tsukamurella pulmonis TaxID=47312 RepID=A0A1H1ACI7_9ACTN|nr:hypothetical protein [Tsukamurella pulmonis]KXO95842.1 hypothetical protein AXK56_16665 [Tsukamurella pulmonis]SDQ36946.1 hypothetical protein SAMN04489765_0142 [Tsukamurella pulmonis]SUQ39395.1 Uncharacterised protein [Tsukamurella pulmonis]
MHVDVIDRERGLFRCEHGEFTEFPDAPAPGPLPPVASFSRWSPPGNRLQYDGIEYVVVDHEGRSWTYELEPAISRVPAETIPAFYEQAEMFDVGLLLPDGPIR